jgi:cell shape-determining protein MreC
MKKYLSTTKGNYRRTPRKSYRLWLAGAIVLIGLGWVFPWLITHISSTILYPINVTTNWVKTSDGIIPEYLRSRSELMLELEELKIQVATDSSTRLSVDRLLEENMQLRAMANAGTSTERLVARVVSNPTKLGYDLLQIDRGTSDGVMAGAPVYIGLDTVVGVVVQVTETYSFVDLFTSPDFETTAYIIGPNVFAVLEGIGGGIARVRLPQGVLIAEKQLVILPGISNGVYGEIVSVENLPTQPEQYGYVAPPVSLNSMRYVSVGLDAVNIKTELEIDAVIKTSIREQFILDSDIISNLSDVFEDEVDEDKDVDTEDEDVETTVGEADGADIEVNNNDN